MFAKRKDLSVSRNLRKIMLFASAFLMFLFMMGVPSSTSAVAGPVVEQAAQGLEVSSPEAQNVSPAQLAKANAYIHKNLPRVHSLLIVKNGKLIFENYYKQGRPGLKDNVHSVSKSVMSTLIGIAIDKGYIASVDVTLDQLLPQDRVAQMTELAKQTKLQDVLTMRTGLDWFDEGQPFWAWYFSDDWVRHRLQEPVKIKPGRVFSYNTSDSHLLSAILAHKTEMNPLDFAQKYLFNPLDISIGGWEVDHDGIPAGGFGLKISPMDMAKLGQLFLQQGIWNGQQIVSRAWVKEATREQTIAQSTVFAKYGYGYQWWTKAMGDYQGYLAWGRGGQFIVVVPQQSLVVVVTSKAGFPLTTAREYAPFFDYVSELVDAPYEAEVPPEIQTFVDAYIQALNSRNLKHVMDLYAEDYAHDDGFFSVDKPKQTALFSTFINRVQDANFVITEFEQEGEIAKIKATIDLFVTNPIEEQLIFRDGKWLFYGNQRGIN